MNKFLKLFILVLLLSLTLGIVKAEEGPFFFDWSKESDEEVSVFHSIYNNGYVFVSYTYEHDGNTPMLNISTYDKNGNFKKTKDYEWYVQDFYDFLVDNEDIYLIASDEIDIGTDGNLYGNYYVGKANNQLEGVVKVIPASSIYIRKEARSLKMSNNRLHVYNAFDNKIYRFSEDLATTESTTNSVQEFAPEVYYNNRLTGAVIFPSDVSINGNNILAIIDDGTNCGTAVTPNPENGEVLPASDTCDKTFVALYNKNLEIQWKHEFADNYYLREVLMHDDYAIVSAIDRDAEKGYLFIYDLDGNLVQTIESTRGFGNLSRGLNGFTASEKCGSTNKSPSVMPTSELTCKDNNVVYVLGHKIETKVEGKGKVKVDKFAKPGSPVTFVVEPEEGYSLGVVKVTDRNGNVVEFHDYTFTMPSADVEVEATFVASKNPNTNTGFLLSLVFLVFCSAFAVIIINYNKVQD